MRSCRALSTVAVALCAASLVACGSGNKPSASGSTSSTSSTASSSSSSSRSSSSSSSPSASGLADGPPFTTGAAGGSGCSPADAASLPEGWWAGQVKKVDGVSIDFDLECFFVGDAANSAASADGAEEIPVPNDFYVRNNNPRTFRETFASKDGPATCVGNSASPFDCTIGDVLGVYASADGTGTIDGQTVFAFPTIWVHVTGTTPDYLWMQFTP